MIVNRTQEDVEKAISIIREKVQAFQPLTDDDLSVLEKGCVTVQTLNRIEGKTKEMFDVLSGMLYVAGHIETTSWSFGQIFSELDFKRIIQNIDKIRKSFLVYKTTPQTPSVGFDYMIFNDMEKILLDLEAYVNDVRDNYRMCGVAVCGD